jgi:predicted CxxxxCH...CXXCH cytochrome family protein
MKRKYPKLRESARGEDCTLRIFPHCNENPETTVLCHLPSGAGMGQKSPDWYGVYGCSSCHDIIDYRNRQGFSEEEVALFSQVALYRTWERMIDKGLIKI